MDKVKFRRTIRSIGDSSMIALPKEILEYLGLEAGKEIVFIADKSKHGKFAAIYVEDKEE